MKKMKTYRTLVLLLAVAGLAGCGKETPVVLSPDCNKVWEYTPAPGQFINTAGTEGIQTPEEACRAAEKLLAGGRILSLGGFGGTLVVGFDHPVVNDGGWNLAIEGNAFEGSSEPGIVWVMQDVNGNGQPDEDWYELKGSEYGKPETRQHYSVTYFRPSEAGQPVRWKDSEGQEGQIDYMESFHRQDFYYPTWIETDSYTLTGTCLQSRTVVENGMVINGSFGWGYADNSSTGEGEMQSDLLGTRRTNHFRICDAMQEDGTPADLPQIDFVKVQTGVNEKGPLIGELSTEIFSIQDYNMIKQL